MNDTYTARRQRWIMRQRHTELAINVLLILFLIAVYAIPEMRK